ncbi:AfsR/SARP family transcriptional regulator [Fodinicola feengrottensis]|uniref:AfsR/SARP family transcriptional regulator n=1 Tax=Fodinicola feengrottensis TaxID=435914 RepID=UPI0013D59A58|nr:BTAD domain-containing putative transcriptional regulator [Fodinicola feengrottensis]
MTAEIEVGADFLVLALGPLQLGGECAVEMTAEKPQRLLAALALQPNRWVSTAELTEALWPEGAPASARGNLKTYVHLLRQLLPAVGEQQRIDSRKGSYRLVVSRDELDVTTFEDLIAAARTTLADGEAGLAADRAAAALRLWRGEPFESLSGHAAEIERVRLAELRHSAADCRADALLADGRADEAIALLRPLASADSLLGEASWERLMRALIQAGRPAEALRTYHELRTGLASELGTEPGPGPRRLYNQLLDADREAGDDVRMSPPAVVSPPVKRQWPGRRNLVIAACIVFVLLVAGGAYAFWPQPTPDQKLMQLVNSTDPIQKRPITMPPPGHLIFGMSNGVDDTSKKPALPAGATWHGHAVLLRAVDAGPGPPRLVEERDSEDLCRRQGDSSHGRQPTSQSGRALAVQRQAGQLLRVQISAVRRFPSGHAYARDGFRRKEGRSAALCLHVQRR